MLFFQCSEINDVLVKIDLTASESECLRNVTSAVEQRFCERLNASIFTRRACEEDLALFGVDVSSTPVRIE